MVEAVIRFEINNDSLTLDDIDNCLFEAGFDDAIVSHSGDGTIAIELSRDANSYADLFESVVDTVINAIPSAKVIQASSDSWQTSQGQSPNPFKFRNLGNPGVDVTTSKSRSQKKLKYIAEIEGGDIVDIPDDKEMLHPAGYFEGLFLHKLKEQGLSNNDLSKMLDLPAEQYSDFLKGKVSVKVTLAKRLEALTGMPCDFWLRAQNKFDNSRR